jgi:hypothetical protein
MSDESRENLPQADQDHDDAAARLVPVGESIKYRRRAQSAEGKLAQLEQQLNDLQSQLDQRAEQLATAEAQRDEAAARAIGTENRAAAQRLMSEAGVIDIETGWLLLSQRLDTSEPVEDDQLAQTLETLLIDKPFLASAPANLPGPTSPQATRGAGVAQLARAAQQAATSGDRRDVAAYLRLRRSQGRQ